MYPGTYAERAPERAALVMAGSGEVITYQDLDDRSNQLAQLLRAAGLQRGDHLALFMENHPRFMEVVWAALRSGLYITTINSHLTAPEVSYIVKDCEAKALVTSLAKADAAAKLEEASTAAVGTGSWSMAPCPASMRTRRRSTLTRPSASPTRARARPCCTRRERRAGPRVCSGRCPK